MAPAPRFDYLVIGGGSGGIATARRAASYGKTVAIIENTNRFGGTCVNVGCVPKKIMWHAADLNMQVDHAKHYGLEASTKQIDWPTLKRKRDEYITRLDNIYLTNLEKDQVTHFFGQARFVAQDELEIELLEGGKRRLAADHICVAVGGHATWPEIEGAQLGISSDGFFELEEMPKKVVVVGAGYIAIELAGVFNSLGAETHLLIRRDSLLRSFDPMLQERVFKVMNEQGVHIHQQTNASKVTTKVQNPDTKKPFPLTVHTDKGDIDAECVLWAIGRKPETSDKNLGTSHSGMKLKEGGYIEVDEYQNTSTKGVYALGDVTGQVELTPVAIAAGRRLANRLFGGSKDDHLAYSNIPSVVFSHPPCGTIGLTEPQAREQYGDSVKIYNSTFNSLFYSMFPAEEKTQTAYKIVCAGPNEKVVGLHIFGDASDEVLQGFGVAVKMGATKADFDNCVAIHPTAAEELVTMK